MSKETERVFRLMKEQLNFEEMTEEEAGKAISKFINDLNEGKINYGESPWEKSDELFNQALEADSIEESKKLAKKAIKENPRNLEAAIFLAECENNLFKILENLNKIIKDEEKILTEEGFFDEDCIGAFWGIHETRPYMRACYRRMELLIDLSRFSEAADCCEQLLKLNENDNMAVRYRLISLYAVLERFQEGIDLYNDFAESTVLMLLPLSILYYKKGDYKRAKATITKMKAANEYIIDCITGYKEISDCNRFTSSVAHFDEF